MVRKKRKWKPVPRIPVEQGSLVKVIDATGAIVGIFKVESVTKKRIYLEGGLTFSHRGVDFGDKLGWRLELFD